jgi:hypothetical protein
MGSRLCVGQFRPDNIQVLLLGIATLFDSSKVFSNRFERVLQSPPFIKIFQIPFIESTVFLQIVRILIIELSEFILVMSRKSSHFPDKW